MTATAQNYETIAVATDSGVATVTFDRAESLNALSVKMATEILAALESFDGDPAVRAIVLTGSGRAFGSGADLKSDRRVSPEGKVDALSGLREIYNPLMTKIRQIGKPVIAAVNGAAVGVSASLALACDLILAAESAYFLLAFVNVGLTVDGGASVWVAGRAGFTRAAEMAMLGDKVRSDQALAWGLVNRVVPDHELGAAVSALAAKLAAGPPASFRASKQLLNDTVFAGFEERLDAEAMRQQDCAESSDFVEGVTAFLEKRPANFTGI